MVRKVSSREAERLGFERIREYTGSGSIEHWAVGEDWVGKDQGEKVIEDPCSED